MRMGEIHLVQQQSRELESRLHDVVAEELSAGRPVIWVDGGCRLDPLRLSPALRARHANPLHALELLLLCRGFTAHQLVEQLRLLGLRQRSWSTEAQMLREARLLVVGDMLTMLNDPEVGRAECRALLRHCVTNIERICRTHQLACLINLGRSERPYATAEQLTVLRRAASTTTISQRTRDGVEIELLPSGAREYIDELDAGQQRLTPYFELEAKRRDCDRVIWRLDVISETSCSDHPKGMRIAEVARNASGM